MSLASAVVAELAARCGQMNQSFDCVEAGRTLRCSFDRCEALAVTVAELSLETPKLATAEVAALKRVSADLAQRVNYLLEPISPVEADAAGCSVQMRSNPPQCDDDGRRYYELFVRRGGSISLCRYEKQPGQPRTRVPATLTHEVVGRLAGDFAAAIDAM
jgi:hypothetical protein